MRVLPHIYILLYPEIMDIFVNFEGIVKYAKLDIPYHTRILQMIFVEVCVPNQSQKQVHC